VVVLKENPEILLDPAVVDPGAADKDGTIEG
jgi:hypothetical protein